MNHDENSNHRRHPARRLLSCALASCLLLGAAPAFAQSTAATIRGQVSLDSAPAAAATVTATNLATGLTRSVQSGANGNYSVAGLPPGSYRIDVSADGKTRSQNVTVQVGQVATLDLGVGGVAETGATGPATTLDTVQVLAPTVVETKTSEVAAYVSTRQIEALPQTSRNFLAFADTVPGMRFETNPSDGSTKLQSGAQSSSNINVFIDGVGQKNYVLQGGITGQDSSRGNPFPQLAIGEYKVITSNYKAEYDQLSSAAVSAVTRSGTNEFHGSFFWDYSNTDLRATKESEKTQGQKERSKDEQYGFAFGGPIVKDVAHFFVTYEGKDYTSPKDVFPGQGYDVSELPAFLQSSVRNSTVPFHEDLYFGKIDWSINQDNLLELTVKRREEKGLGNVGDQNTESYATDTRVNETRIDLRWQLTAGDWLNDAHVTYEKAFWAMEPNSFGNGYVLTDGTSNTGNLILATGSGSGGYQDKGQDGYSFQNDLTFSGWDNHTLKMGVKYKQVKLNTLEQQPYNPQYYYDINESTEIPYYISFASGFSGTSGGQLESKSKQFGIYIQDDWQVTDRLTLNLGLRWDYEKTPSYLDAVTDPDVVAAIYSQDPNAAAGQTYADTLALGGINISDYISTGSNRKAFKDAWQPRLGFSYDLSGDERHVLFGGAGRSYDRNLFDYLALEQTKATFGSYGYQVDTALHSCTVGSGRCLAWDESLRDQATLEALVAGNSATGREVDLLANNLKVPYSDQFSIGIRDTFQMFGYDWNSSVTLQRIVSKDGFAYLLGNRLPDGSFFADGTISGSPWGYGIPGYGSLILGTNGIETRNNSLLVGLEKPYTSSSPWSLNVAYTYSDAKENRQFGEHYALDYATLADYGWFTSGGLARHRLVVSGVADGPWDTTFSGKLTLATPEYYYTTYCPNDDNTQCRIRQYHPDHALGFKQLDLAAQKVWDTGSNLKLKMRLDLLNVFNWKNFDSYSVDWDADSYTGYNQYVTRTAKLSLGLDW
ncbi:TonB-dependent receptor [Stenotrophomonas sp. MMGLT7]|uniref:TonB-dependent receptor n=1 Tax=Stenotrophomonas sp. MMGLT7 TaxID=2901227 RepID=UPI001E6152D0|nr:TonB-dependent receptor [Stenotrophomonas sp. MMGLT7]MCD7097278.1 TonB-dependent receptor [Stenotrophomonas sp. MMGLT7]